MKTENREIRISGIIQRAASADSESRTVEGYGCVFDSQSENLGWFETIHQGAITEDIINASDCFAKLNHRDDAVLARSKNGKGSLLLEVDEKGLHYLFDAPHTAAGDELLEHLKRGEITQSSFAFVISDEEGAENWRNENGVLYRDIFKICYVADISPVYQPAYTATECSKRGSEMITKNEEINAKMNALQSEIEAM